MPLSAIKADADHAAKIAQFTALFGITSDVDLACWGSVAGQAAFTEILRYKNSEGSLTLAFCLSGKHLSKRLSVFYEKGLSTAAGTWSLLYRVAGRTTLRARTGLDNAVEVIWSWRWD